MTTRPWASLSPLAAACALALALAAPAACTHAEAKGDPAPTTAAATTSPATSSAATTKVELDDASGCATASDCAFTRVAAGACCPLMCTPRVVTKLRAAELEKNIAVCNGGRECPLPPCRAPVADFRIACEQQRCVMKVTPVDDAAR